jgi:resolvase-like protein
MVETHPEKRLIGYARVGTVGQTLDSQLEQLRAAGCVSRSIYREKATGARPDRRELNRMLGKLGPGDDLHVLDHALAKDRHGKLRCEMECAALSAPSCPDRSLSMMRRTCDD